MKKKLYILLILNLHCFILTPKSLSKFLNFILALMSQRSFDVAGKTVETIVLHNIIKLLASLYIHLVEVF